jgi:tRNA uridine 5-carboxymethylaminomethyl modification enzyme
MVRVLGKKIDHEYNLGDLLRRPDITYHSLMSMENGEFKSAEIESLDDVSRETILEQVEISAKYSGYIEKQKEEVERAAGFENLHLPKDLDYLSIDALSFEVRQKLTKFRPETVGLASRISGITPAAISLLLIHLKRMKAKRDTASVGEDAVFAEGVSAEFDSE